MGLRQSIAFPIIILILLLISLTSLTHYFIQLRSLKTTFFSQNKGKAEQVHFMIQSIINMESEKLEALSHVLIENQHLGQGIADYITSGENFDFVRAAVDRIYQSAEVDIIEIIDHDGRVVYRAHDPERKGDYTEHWGMGEALEGTEITATSHSVEGWGMRVFIPVYANNTVVGAIMLGTIIDDSFATDIARAIGVEISIGSMNGLIASSVVESKRAKTDFKTLILSLTEDRQISIEDSEASKVVLYAPLLIVDEVFAFVVEINTRSDDLIIEQNKKQIFRLFIIILLIALAIGIGLTLYLVRPLRKLTNKTVETVRDISGDTILLHKGNEVSRLIHSFDLMIQKIKGHLSERKKTERKLIEEKERLAITLRSIGDTVITTDTEGRIQLFNQGAENLTGWSQKEVVGKPLGDIYSSVEESTRSPQINPVKYVLEKNGYGSFANKSLFTAKDGTVRIMLESGAPIVGEGGTTVGAVFVFRDITEQEKQEEDRIKAHQLESLGTLAGGIAHDFNNILTAILGNTSLALMYAGADRYAGADSKVCDNLHAIEKASHRAKELTQKLLTFSKGGAPIKETAKMSKLIKDSAEFILSGTNTKCNFFLPDKLWPTYVDKGQISQAIQNLCLNAHEAMRESGTVELKAENTVITEEDNLDLRSGHYIKLSVKDYGRGISPVDLPKIFDPYFSTKREGGGLGLSIVHSIVERHGGHVAVHSDLGKGTVFTLYIPALYEKETVQEEKSSRPVVGSGRILFMDDEKMLRDVVSAMLDIMGYKVTVAANGEEAIKVFKEVQASGDSFDVVILDLTIPGGMGGRDTVKELISIDPSVRAIVASGYSNDPVLAEFEKFGFKGAMVKPFDTEKLKVSINEVIGM
jgi:PAS domain S-box-containing protein